MGDAVGKVRFKSDNKMAWFIYNDTTDFAYDKLYESENKMLEAFHGTYADKTYANNLDCTCGNEEDVELYESYGGGTIWEGKACRNCMVITKNQDPDTYTEKLDLKALRKWVDRKTYPDWCEKNFCNSVMSEKDLKELESEGVK